MQVKKRRNLDLKKPLVISRKFRIPIETVRKLQRGLVLDLDDNIARNLKQWGMVSFVNSPCKTLKPPVFVVEPDPIPPEPLAPGPDSFGPVPPKPIETQPVTEHESETSPQDVSRETITGNKIDVNGVVVSAAQGDKKVEVKKDKLMTRPEKLTPEMIAENKKHKSKAKKGGK